MSTNANTARLVTAGRAALRALALGATPEQQDKAMGLLLAALTPFDRVSAEQRYDRDTKAYDGFEVLATNPDSRASMRGCWHATVKVGRTIYNVGTLKDVQRGKNAGKGVALYGYVRIGNKDLIGTNGMGRYLKLDGRQWAREHIRQLLIAAKLIEPIGRVAGDTK